MVAKLEMNQKGGENVRRMVEGGNHPIAELPKELGVGESERYFTENIPYSGAIVKGDFPDNGCIVNGEQLPEGYSVVIGNLKITGA